MDNGEAGVPVKALYDYDAAEPDELTFKIGTLIRTFFNSALQFFKGFFSALESDPVVLIIRNFLLFFLIPDPS